MSELFIGLMSGTSMDAVDAVLVDFQLAPLKILATHSQPIPAALRDDLMNICSPGMDEINRLGALDIQTGLLFAETANILIQQARIDRAAITAIGSHGQTIRHQPDHKFPFTLQIGDPNSIAVNTGITTIADFRRRDMAVGGQGAPLAPAFHNAVLRSAQENRIILNLGGIANITYLPADLTQPVIGFDTGPANTLLDNWINKQQGVPFDDRGQWAASGKVNTALLNLLLSDAYFKRPPPKSTGREYFNVHWLEKNLTEFEQKLSPADIQATLCELTACSIAQAIKQLRISNPTLLICGGGVKNVYLLERLRLQCETDKMQLTDDFGIPAKWLEAIAFAWLAQQTLHKKPGNLPPVTGAEKAVILGGIYSSR